MSQKNYLLILVCLFFLYVPAQAQKVLQIEKRGSYKTEKIYIDQEITYRVHGDDYWYRGAIKDLLVEEKIILFYDRFVPVDSIAAFRYERGRMGSLGKQIFWFGTAWSVFAAVGTATDRNDDTNYRKSDAIVTGTSWLLALLVPKIFRYKIVRFGKRKRLRLLDLTFTKEDPIPRP